MLRFRTPLIDPDVQVRALGQRLTLSPTHWQGFQQDMKYSAVAANSIWATKTSVSALARRVIQPGELQGEYSYFRRERSIYCSLEIVAHSYLQFPGFENALEWAEVGFANARFYFKSDWNAADVNMRQAREERILVDWCDSFSRGLLMGCIANVKADALKQYADWPWDELSDCRGDMLTPHDVPLWLDVARVACGEDLLSTAEACQSRRQESLREAIGAVHEGREEIYQTNIYSALVEFLETKQPICHGDARIADNFALIDSVIVCVAELRGLRRPRLEERLRDHLMLRL